MSSWREYKKKAKEICIEVTGRRISSRKKYGGFCVSIEKMESGFDLSHPLMSRPEESQKSKTVTLVTETPCETMTSGFDLRWPLISQPEHQVEGVQIKKAA